jgi:hypothetical protein
MQKYERGYVHGLDLIEREDEDYYYSNDHNDYYHYEQRKCTALNLSHIPFSREFALHRIKCDIHEVNAHHLNTTHDESSILCRDR